MDGALSRPISAGFWLIVCVAGLTAMAITAGKAAGAQPTSALIAQAAQEQQDQPRQEEQTGTQPAGAAPTGGRESEAQQGFVPADGPPRTEQEPTTDPGTAPATPPDSGAPQPPPAGGAEAMQPAGPPPQPGAEGTQPPGPADRREEMAGPERPEETDAMAGREQAATKEDWEKGALENLYYPDPYSVRVAVLNASGLPRRAGMVAFFLEAFQGRRIEKKLGKRISVVNLSNLPGVRLRRTVISYRPGNLRAALLMADVIPGKQVVTPMNEERSGKIGIDVEIRVGRETP